MHHHGVDICVIEDDDSQRRLLVEQLRRAGHTVCEAEDGPQGIHSIYADRPRIVLCDLVLPNLDGIQICRQVRADPTLDGTYIIVLTAHSKSGIKKKALNAGADDYVAKPFDLDEIKARIRNGMRFHRLQERLHRAALTDGLTGLWNYSQFRQFIEREFQRTRRYGGVASLLMLDLDHFKTVNDNHGHEVGNQVLKLTARLLQSVVRETDIVARYGGEEFAVICPATDLDAAAELAERIRYALPRRVRLSDHPKLTIHASIGVATTKDGRADSMAALINLCDQALYHGKRSGRNCTTRCDQIGDVFSTPAVRVDEMDRLHKEIVALSARGSEICHQSVSALLQALEQRDADGARHSRNVQVYTQWLVTAAQWPEPMQAAAENAALLHDLGRIGVPDELLSKSNPLDPAERFVMRRIPAITCKILEPLRVFETETQMIRHLREQFDGTGHPDGLAGEDIPIGSRLIAVAEMFDMLTCDRASRGGRRIDEALAIICEDSGTRFDPAFCQLLRDTVSRQRKGWESQVEKARNEVSDPTAARAIA